MGVYLKSKDQVLNVFKEFQVKAEKRLGDNRNTSEQTMVVSIEVHVMSIVKDMGLDIK